MTMPDDPARRDVLRLQALVPAEVSARRPDADGAPRRHTVVPEDLVPGDVVELRTGDRVPADCRVLSAEGLLVDQAALSGEAEACAKRALPAGGTLGAPLDWPHLLYAGTAVLAGHATAVVVATGGPTVLGALARGAASAARAPGTFGRSVDRVTWLLLRFAALRVLGTPLLHAAAAGSGGGVQAALFALAVAVGLVPELLPAIVAATPARGAAVMHRGALLVRQLDAVQNLGAMQVLCADKTGTLAQGTLRLQCSTDAAGADDGTALRWAALAAAKRSYLRRFGWG